MKISTVRVEKSIPDFCSSKRILIVLRRTFQFVWNKIKLGLISIRQKIANTIRIWFLWGNLSGFFAHNGICRYVHIMITSLLRYKIYKNERTWHNTTGQNKNYISNHILSLRSILSACTEKWTARYLHIYTEKQNTVYLLCIVCHLHTHAALSDLMQMLTNTHIYIYENITRYICIYIYTKIYIYIYIYKQSVFLQGQSQTRK